MSISSHRFLTKTTLKFYLEMKFLLYRFLLLQLVTLPTVIQSVYAVCDYTITDQNKLYNYNLAAPSQKYPHGVLSEDGYYKVSSNGTVVWFQVGSTSYVMQWFSTMTHQNVSIAWNVVDQIGVAWAAVHLCLIVCLVYFREEIFSYKVLCVYISGYPVCTTIGRTPTITTDLIDKGSPQMGLIVKMWHNTSDVNCSLSVSVLCDSKQVQGPNTVERVGFCHYVTQLRHPSGCANIVSASSNGVGWFGTLLIIILGVFGGYMIVGAAYRFFYLGIRGIDIIPNLEVWASLPHRAQGAFMSLVRRFRGPSEGYRSSYSPVAF